MYPCVRLTHIVLLCNQSDGLRLSEQFSLVICYLNTIFFVYQLITIATRHCVALQRLITLLSLSLLHCITLYYSCPPPLLILRSFSSVLPRLEVTLFLFTSFMEMEDTNLKKNKIFFLLLSLSCHKQIFLYFNTSIHYCLYLLYLTLTLLGYVFFWCVA